jgi:antitoxin component of MazEF toxin-antitoxin module
VIRSTRPALVRPSVEERGVTVGRSGHHLAVRRPAEIVDAIQLRAGERVAVEARDGEAVIRAARQRVSLEVLFRGRSPDRRVDLAGADDWEADIGREIVPE